MRDAMDTDEEEHGGRCCGDHEETRGRGGRGARTLGGFSYPAGQPTDTLLLNSIKSSFKVNLISGFCLICLYL